MKTMDQKKAKIETEFVEPGTLPTPGPIGRVVRLLAGAWLITALMALTSGFTAFAGGEGVPTNWTFWAFVAIAFQITPHVVNIGFGLNWKRRPQAALLGIGLALIGIDLVFFGNWWGPPLGIFLSAWLVYFAGHLGSSFVLSALLGTPGCEMRAIPQLISVVTGRDNPEHYCPGPLDAVDRWEIARKAGN